MAYVAVLWSSSRRPFSSASGSTRIRAVPRTVHVRDHRARRAAADDAPVVARHHPGGERNRSCRRCGGRQLLPLLFFISAIAMGYCHRRVRGDAGEPRLSPAVGTAAVELDRAGDILVDRRLPGHPHRRDRARRRSRPRLRAGATKLCLFWLETALFGAALVLLSTDRWRRTERYIFLAACALLLAGTLLPARQLSDRLQPGARLEYFPSVPELMVTIGLVSLQSCCSSCSANCCRSSPIRPARS